MRNGKKLALIAKPRHRIELMSEITISLRTLAPVLEEGRQSVTLINYEVCGTLTVQYLQRQILQRMFQRSRTMRTGCTQVDSKLYKRYSSPLGR